MIKKKFIHLACCIFFVFTHAIITAQETQPYNSIEKVCTLLSQSPCMRGNFIQTKTVPSLKRALISSGTFTIAAEAGIIWNTQQPFASVLVVGSDHISQSAADGLMTRMDTGSNPTFMEFSETLSAAFSGNISKIHNSFTAGFSYIGTSWTIALRPKNAAIRQFIQEIKLTGNSVLQNVVMTEQNGSTISYSFSDHAFSQDLTDEEQKLFSF